jgi:hypothetical protein
MARNYIEGVESNDPGAPEIYKTVTATQVSTKNALDVNVVQTVGGGGGTVELGATSLAALENITIDAIIGEVEIKNDSGSPVPVSVSSLPLPTGAATAANQLPDGHNVTVDNASIAVTGTFFQATQPVSAASLPLPTGAATAANQATEIASLASIDAGIPAALGQTTMAASMPVVIASNQSTLPISAASLPLPTGAATSALQTQPGVDIGDVTINNAAGASAVNIQDGGNSITVDNAVLSVVGGGTEATAQRVTIASDSTGVLSVDDNGGSLTVDGTVAVSGSVAVTGPLTDAQLRATPVPVSGSVTANAGTNLNTSALNLETTQSAMSAKLPATLGQKTMANSMAVVIASDQSAVPVSGTVSVTGVATAANQTTEITSLQLLDDVVLTDGAAIGTKGSAIGGTDGTNFQIISTTTQGNVYTTLKDSANAVLDLTTGGQTGIKVMVVGDDDKYVRGAQANNSSQIGGPVVVGSVATNSVPTAVTDGNVVNNWADLNGRLHITGDSTMTPLLVDTELPTAASRSDGESATPTTPMVAGMNYVLNGTTLDRQRSVITGTNSTGTGIAAVGLVAQLNEVNPTSITEGRFGNLKINAKRELKVEINETPNRNLDDLRKYAEIAHLRDCEQSVQLLALGECYSGTRRFCEIR